MGTITSANAQVMLNVPGVFPTPVQLAGFAADDAFTQDAYDVAETRMGVDGVLSAGFTPSEKPFHITFQPDSPSIAAFDIWGQAENQAKEKFVCSLTIVLPSVGKAYHLTTGWLKSFKALPDAKKVLDPQSYMIGYQDITTTPI